MSEATAGDAAASTKSTIGPVWSEWAHSLPFVAACCNRAPAGASMTRSDSVDWPRVPPYYPAAARQRSYWSAVDVGYPILRAPAAIGIIWDFKPVPERVRNLPGHCARPQAHRRLPARSADRPTTK